MKKILTILLSTTTLLSLGQVATIEINNPAPRLSDGVELSISFDQVKRKKKSGQSSLDEFRLQNGDHLGNANINFHTNILDTGLVKLGPFKFTINKTTFITEVITVRVYPDLPEVNDGIWMKLVTFKDETFLILEQRVSHGWQKENGGHSSRRTDSEGVNFARLDLYKIYEYGVDMEVASSSISSSTTTDAILGTGTVSYKYTKYSVSKLNTLKGKLEITKDFINAYPENIGITTVEIK